MMKKKDLEFLSKKKKKKIGFMLDKSVLGGDRISMSQTVQPKIYSSTMGVRCKQKASFTGEHLFVRFGEFTTLLYALIFGKDVNSNWTKIIKM